MDMQHGGNNGDGSPVGNGFGGFGGGGLGMGVGGLDQSSVAKQMAALSAAGQVRMQTSSVQPVPRQLAGQSSARSCSSLPYLQQNVTYSLLFLVS